MSEPTPYVPLKLPERVYCDENGTLTVYRNDDGYASLRSYVPFANALEVLNRFDCLLVDLCLRPGDVLDFAAIKRPERIRRMRLSFDNKVECRIPVGDAGLTQLTDLTVEGKFPKHFLHFRKLPALKLLEVGYDEKHLSWQKHAGLLDLKVHRCSAPDLRGFSNLVKLKRLRLLRGSIGSLNGIEAMPSLDTLFTYGAQKLLDLQAVIQSKSLVNLMFEASKKITNWDFLSGMPALQWLNVEVADSVGFVRTLNNLRHVHVAQKILDGDQTPIDQHPSILRGIQEGQAAQAASGEIYRAYQERFKDTGPWRHLIDMDSLARPLAS